MKKTMFSLATIVCIAGLMMTGCQSSADKVKNAQDNLQAASEKVETANKELNQAMKDSIQQFRKESEEKLNANEKSIAEFKVKISKEKQENRARYERKLADLELQNREMRKNLEEFNDAQRDKWESFRDRFKHDMDAHARTIRDFWTGGR